MLSVLSETVLGDSQSACIDGKDTSIKGEHEEFTK